MEHLSEADKKLIIEAKDETKNAAEPKKKKFKVKIHQEILVCI
jgi:hypothetical protein